MSKPYDTPRQPDAEEALIRSALTAEINHRVRSARIIARRAVIVAEAGDLPPAARNELESAITAALAPLAEIDEVRVALTGERRRRRLIAVGSGKGGVGKSTLTTNLAVALARMGRRVGVIDGDIYGPSQPKLLRTEGIKPTATPEGDKLVAIDSPYGVKVLSMGHIVAPGKALAWRGPMTGKALTQLVDADWGETDLLLVDLPPGTGDVQLSMLSAHKPDGAVLVSTPQDLALIDAARAGQLFEQGEVPIIGLVENMAGYCCPECGHISDPFGSGGVEKFAAALEIPFLGRVPLTLATRIAGDKGEPPAAGTGEEAQPFVAIAERLARWLDTGRL
ncbi:Mrp/NBP35 family ATP-binding protein [Erythrobacter dokdonensis]|jgi:ATP-binding protein involved in chromosome partitioning|uniref:Iron-sulfur cluster carrier protein n=1 Tax=Erythrobacter dokdonensis DSW-74 TaxID=1300349 RepID=A0A1A7BCN7_9SPHN|nr:Mrp/NBP35 family ATP-binding protein [Erythrobacter dokdonensis]MEE4316604.1 Mrp/NBP35 family ATP-binding protein [Erythrobacter sp.]OBV10259.1 ATPase [Erythrobacter dokdonensis DSW-74]